MPKFEKYGIVDAEIAWPKFFAFNKDTKYHPDGEYSCVATLSKDTKEELVSSYQIQETRFKDLGNGSYEFKFKRRHKMSEDWLLEEPFVFDYEGAKARMEAEEGGDINDYAHAWEPEQDGLIGNGSKARIKFRVYKGANSPNEMVTLEAVGITSLVSYTSGANAENSRPRF
jgi:hypothetical protein|tara:strand:- start:2366 stop:2878 length:513 start_codon:yes stop_codon:yes gene_type:complete